MQMNTLEYTRMVATSRTILEVLPSQVLIHKDLTIDDTILHSENKSNNAGKSQNENETCVRLEPLLISKESSPTPQKHTAMRR